MSLQQKLDARYIVRPDPSDTIDVLKEITS